nr:DUF3298 domain-containing protein [Maliibacterium massiliense]
MKGQKGWGIALCVALCALLCGCGADKGSFVLEEQARAPIGTRCISEQGPQGNFTLYYPCTQNPSVNRALEAFAQMQRAQALKAWARDEAKGALQVYSRDMTFQTSWFNRDKVSFLFQVSTYEGGVHPQVALYSLHFDLRTGELWQLEDLLDGQKAPAEALYSALEEAMARTGAAQDAGTLAVPRAQTALRTFALDGRILHFYFAPGTVAPQAAGIVDIPVDLHALRGVLAKEVQLHTDTQIVGPAGDVVPWG